MTLGPQWLLIAAVAAVGVLHTIVPDHWVPITLIARQRGWSKAETARAAFQAGIGHVVSTLVIAALVWIAGVEVASRFGHIVDVMASIALIAFGGWIAISAWRDLSGGGHGHGHSHGHGHGHGHSHAHDFAHLDVGGIHGPELQQVPTGHGDLFLSIYETGVPPRFRLTGAHAASVQLETLRPDGARQTFCCANRGTYWESVDQIPEPHGFDVTIIIDHSGHAHDYHTAFADHHGHEHDDDHGHGLESTGDMALVTRARIVNEGGEGTKSAPHRHEHRHKTTSRTALLLILGSSPMVEGIPAFFAASRFGTGLIMAMSVIFAISTIATYMLLGVSSTAGLQRVHLGAFERYGEVFSGAFIALIGVAFWIWPAL
jgi:hypothetical protein